MKRIIRSAESTSSDSSIKFMMSVVDADDFESSDELSKFWDGDLPGFIVYGHEDHGRLGSKLSPPIPEGNLSGGTFSKKDDSGMFTHAELGGCKFDPEVLEYLHKTFSVTREALEEAYSSFC